MRILSFDIETFSTKSFEFNNIEKTIKRIIKELNLNDNQISILKHNLYNVITQITQENGNPNFGIGVIKDMHSGDIWIFDNKDDMKKFLTNYHKHKETILYIGHNIFNFDMRILFTPDELYKKFDIIFSNSKILKMKVKGKPIHFIDTYNIFHSSLKVIAKSLNMEKGDYQEKLKIWDKKEFDEHKNEIINYCENDTDIINKLFLEYISFIENKINRKIKTIRDIPFTASQFSFFTYNELNKKMFNGKLIYDDLLYLETYRGGRVEPIYMGLFEKPIYVYDLNSLYPYVMRNCFFPIGFIGEYYLDEITQNMLWEYEGMGLFEIDAPYGVFGFYDNGNFIDIGILPIKMKIDKNIKLVFPIGKFYGFFNFPEIRYAILKGYKIKPLYVQLWSREYLPKIKEFIDYFYELKKDHKGDIMGDLAKIILNSLYGKFGQNQIGDKIISIDELYDLTNKNPNITYSYLNDEDYVQVKTQNINKSRSSYYNIASYITSWARVILLSKIDYVIKRGGKIYYMDTDSIFTDIKINDNSFIGNEIGKMKLEKEGKEILILGSKNYIINGKMYSKGIPKNAYLIYEDEEYKIYAYVNFPKKSQITKGKKFELELTIKIVKPTYKRINGKNEFTGALLYPKEYYLIIEKKENIDKINEILKKINLIEKVKIILV
jgi:DNA polymerase elongation subunit (family B)